MNKFIALFAVLVTAFAASTTYAATSIPMVDSFLGEMTIGTTGEQVVVLQDFLRAEGVFTLKSTGYYGPITEGALKKYQTNNGITATGMLDAATLAVMQTDYVSGEVAAKAAIERNPQHVPFALDAVSAYIKGLDVMADGTAAIVKQLQMAVSAFERIMN